MNALEAVLEAAISSFCLLYIFDAADDFILLDRVGPSSSLTQSPRRKDFVRRRWSRRVASLRRSSVE